MAEHDALPAGMRFGELEILRVLGVGGFGIVYLARDHSLEREVALKEYMPSSLATRGEGAKITVRSGSFAETFALGLRSFVNEARLLAKFDHPSLVKVYRFWEANGTAYMVMPYLQGRTLREARKAMGQAPDETWLRGVLDPILGALEVLHREGVFHRDIAPDNILLSTDGPPILLDFGAARRVISDRTQSLTAILKPSYAPIEQYAEMSALRQGPWTDLYALGAVAHFLLAGSPPGPSTARALQDEMVPLWMRHFPGVSPRFLAAIDWALAVRPKERPQNVEELRAALDGRIEPPATERHDTVGAGSAPAPLADAAATSFEPTRRVGGPGITTTFEPTMRVAPPRPAPTQAPTRPASVAAVPPTAVPRATVATAAAPAKTTTQAAAPTRPPARAPDAPTPAVPPPARGIAPRVLIAVAAVVIGLAAGAAVRYFGLLGGRAAAAPVVATTPPAAPAAAETPAATPAVNGETPRAEAAPAAAAAVAAKAVAPLEPSPAPAPRTAAAEPTAGRTNDPRPSAAAPLPTEKLPETAAAVAPPERPRPTPVRDPAPATPPPAAPVAQAAAAVEPATAREACGSRVLFALAGCMDRECRNPRYSEQPDCVKLREDKRRRGLQ